MCFTKILRGFVQCHRSQHDFRVLSYLEEFLVAAAPPGWAATDADVANGRRVVSCLFDQLGLVRKVGKECWKGARTINHFGMHLNSRWMRVYVSEKKAERVRRLSKKLLLLAQQKRRLVNRELLEHFCGVCVSLTLALPLARFYTRSVYLDIAGTEQEERGQARPWPCPSVTTVTARLVFLASTDPGRGPRAPTMYTNTGTSFGRSRRGLGRYHRHGPPGRVPGFVEGSRFLERRGPCRVDHAQGTESSPLPTAQVLLRLCLRPPDPMDASARGQPSRGQHPQRDGLRQQADDGGVEEAAQALERLTSALGRPLVAHRGEPVRRLPVPHMESRGRTRLLAGSTIHPGAVQLRSAGILRPLTGRAFTGSAQTDRYPDAGMVGRRASSAEEPSLQLSAIGRSEDPTGGGTGCALGSLLASPDMVRALETAAERDSHPGRPRGGPILHFEAPQPSMASRRGRDRVRKQWSAGIQAAVLDKAGHFTDTGGVEEAARLLSELDCAQSTWTARASQIARLFRFCDEDMRCPLPASEGDVLAFIGYLSLEGQLAPESLPQYISAVSRYHELHSLPSPTKTGLAKALMRAYVRRFEDPAASVSLRIGCSAEMVHHILQPGLASSAAYDVACRTAVVMAFIFKVRSV